MSLAVEIQDVGPWRFAVTRHKGPYTGIAGAITTAVTWAGAKGLLTGAPMVVGIYYDNPELTPLTELRSAGGLSVPGDVAIDGEGVEELVFPVHRAAVVTHTGPYETLPQTYHAIMEWLTSTGETWTEDGPSVEHYIDDPTNTPPQELRTIIHAPLA